MISILILFFLQLKYCVFWQISEWFDIQSLGDVPWESSQRYHLRTFTEAPVKQSLLTRSDARKLRGAGNILIRSAMKIQVQSSQWNITHEEKSILTRLEWSQAGFISRGRSI